MSLLASSDQVKKAMNLSVEDIHSALSNSGYRTERGEIHDAEFKGFNGTAFVYVISFSAPESEGMATGNIYVELKRRAFMSDFEFYANY